MRIVVIIGRYPPVFGGATPTLKTLFSEMVNRGHEVVFLTPMYSPGHPKYEFYNNIKVVRIPPALIGSFAQLRFVCKALYYMEKEKLNPQVIVDTIPYGISMPLLQGYAKYKKIPLVARLSQVGTDEPLAALKGKARLIKSHFIHGYDFTICISTALAKRCAQAGIKNNKYAKVHNCVDNEVFSPLHSNAEKKHLHQRILPEVKGPIVIVPGSVSPRKRSHLALAAWKIIKQEYCLDGTLVFVGPLKSSGQDFDSDYVTNILEKARSHDLLNSVIFTGQKENIDEYYKISDLLLFVSNREGLPNVLLEGMSCGLPIVCTRIQDITDDILQDGVEGFYANDDPRDIAEKIFPVLTDPNLRSKMSALCVKRSKAFIVGDVAEKMESILENLVDTCSTTEQIVKSDMGTIQDV
jgi:glycosyltransferase involved in cell wall biosynthesis